MDDARRRVLARRAAFLAVATAGLHCDPKPEPQVCLSQIQPHPADGASEGDASLADDAPDAPVAPPAPCLELAAPCLSAALPPDPLSDAGPAGQKDAGKDAGKPSAKDAGKPNPCLNVL